jgi:6-pyruvoyltetrahydropterin/6-carboxytetrahydropterin synthase
MFVQLRRQFSFEAAHFLPTFPDGHKCRRMHGHSYRVDVVVEGDVDPDRGYLIDYGTIAELCEPVRKRLDHYLLNEIEGLANPTAENLARWIWQRLKPAIESAVKDTACPPAARPKLAEIVVHETCTSACHYRGE